MSYRYLEVRYYPGSSRFVVEMENFQSRQKGDLLNWKGHKSNLSDFLSSLRITKQFADVTLVCDNKQEISAHKVVLGACSPMLATILSHHSNEENATIYLDGVDLSDMQTLMDFIYLGQASVATERQNNMKCLATNLKMEKLFEYIFESDGGVKAEKALIRKVSNKETIKKHKTGIDNTKYLDGLPRKIEKNLDPLSTEIYDTESILAWNEYILTSHSLTNHILEEETTMEGRPWSCQTCDSKFKAKAHLQIHIQTKHKGIFFQCNQCESQFATKASMKAHIKGKHLGLKFKCHICSKEFTQNGALKTHIEGIHYGMSYPCKYCEYDTNDQSNLNKHMKKIHSMPKPEIQKVKVKREGQI